MTCRTAVQHSMTHDLPSRNRCCSVIPNCTLVAPLRQLLWHECRLPASDPELQEGTAVLQTQLHFSRLASDTVCLDSVSASTHIWKMKLKRRKKDVQNATVTGSKTLCKIWSELIGLVPSVQWGHRWCHTKIRLNFSIEGKQCQNKAYQDKELMGRHKKPVWRLTFRATGACFWCDALKFTQHTVGGKSLKWFLFCSKILVGLRSSLYRTQYLAFRQVTMKLRHSDVKIVRA